MSRKRRIRERQESLQGTRVFFIIFALFWNAIVITALVAIASAGDVEWFALLFMVPFVLVGIGVGYLALNPRALAKVTQGQSQNTSGLPAIDDRPPRSSGHVKLEPQVSPVGKLIGMIVICLFWNGIVSVFLWQVFQGFQRGNIEWFLVIFLIPFLLVGLGFLGGVFYYLLALANPKPVLKVRSTRIKPGESFELSWEMSGSVDRLDNFRIYIEGKEEATYYRGTTRYTDRSVFSTTELVKSSGVSRMRRGSLKASIPTDTMHTFNGDNNQIKWTICVHGEIPRWPDVKEEFEIDVVPFEPGELRLQKK